MQSYDEYLEEQYHRQLFEEEQAEEYFGYVEGGKEYMIENNIPFMVLSLNSCEGESFQTKEAFYDFVSHYNPSSIPACLILENREGKVEEKSMYDYIDFMSKDDDLDR